MTQAIDNILFLQKPEFMERQRNVVAAALAKALPEAIIYFADCPEAVPSCPVAVIITPTLPWLPDVLNRVRGCWWVHFLSAGIEQAWDMPVNWEPFAMTKSSGIHGPQMSEYAIGALLYFAKDFDRFVVQSRHREWKRTWLNELTGQTLMVLGAGSVGEMVGRRARAFGMRVLAVKRSVTLLDWADETFDLDVARSRLSEVNALVVVLPLTSATRGIVDSGILSRLPKGAVVVDISRGGVVKEEALVEGLANGHLRGAAIDVFESEPLAVSSPLWDRSNVLLTPHVAGTSPYYLKRALDVFLINVRSWLSGTGHTTAVDKATKY